MDVVRHDDICDENVFSLMHENYCVLDDLKILVFLQHSKTRVNAETHMINASGNAKVGEFAEIAMP